MLGLEWTPSSNFQITNKQSTMPYKYWKMSSKHAGKYSQGISVMVGFYILCFSCLYEWLYEYSLFPLSTGIKKYIVGLIIKTSSDAETLDREKVYLNKLNMILVQVRNIK